MNTNSASAYLISSAITSKSPAVPSRIISLDQDQFTVGRSCDTNFCINSPIISRIHAIFVKKTNQWTIADNKSLNGVFVNGVKLEPHEPKVVTEGDVICFGIITSEEQFEFTFTLKHDLIDEPSNSKKRRTMEDVNVNGAIDLTSRSNVEDEEKKSDKSHLDATSNETSECCNKFSIEEIMRQVLHEKELLKLDLLIKDSQLKIMQKEVEITAERKINETHAVINNVEAELECCICSELMINAVVLSCSHTFCSYCIEQWKTKKIECPVCRSIITNQTFAVTLDSIVNCLVNTWDNPRKMARKQLIESRNRKLIHKLK